MGKIEEIDKNGGKWEMGKMGEIEENRKNIY